MQQITQIPAIWNMTDLFNHAKGLNASFTTHNHKKAIKIDLFDFDNNNLGSVLLDKVGVESLIGELSQMLAKNWR